MQETAEIVIVGGGVIGVSIAYHLAQRQAGRIILLERDSLASGSTGRSVATLDLLTLHPSAVDLFACSAAFFSRCDELLGAPCGFEQTGSIVLAGTEQEDALAAAVSRMRSAGIDVLPVELDELSTLEPGLALDGVNAASFAAEAGYLDPALTTQAFAGAARKLGVDIRQGQTVTGLLSENGRIRGAATAEGPIKAPVVVVAAGAWSTQLLPTEELHFPLQPVQHPVVCIHRPPGFVPAHHGLLDLTTGIYARPETGGLTLVGSIDPDVGYDRVSTDVGHGYVHDDYIMWCMERLIQRYPALEASELRDGWSGIMAIMPDWQPVIGAWPDYSGLYTAVGFSGRGFQISPAVGKFLAELIVGEHGESRQLAPFSASRFANDRSRGSDHDVNSLLG